MATRIEITKLRHYDKGYLNGFVDIVIHPLGIGIHNITWFSKDGEDWVNLPREKYTNSDGEDKYRPFVTFPEKPVYEGFQAAAVKAIKEYVLANPQEDQPQKQSVPVAPEMDCPF